MKETFQSALNNLKRHPAGYTVVVLVLVLASIVVPQLPETDRLLAFVVAALFVTVSVVFFHKKDVDQNKDPSSTDDFKYDPDEELVRSLKDTLNDERFVPDVIVGIARGGLIVAGYLSKQLTREPIIPVISLWRRRNTVDYQNSFNRVSFNKQDLALDASGPIKTLIVDAFCIHGSTLKLAKAYINESVGNEDVLIKTAAIYLRLDVGDRKTLPDFVVEETKNPVYAFGERE